VGFKGHEDRRRGPDDHHIFHVSVCSGVPGPVISTVCCMSLLSQKSLYLMFQDIWHVTLCHWIRRSWYCKASECVYCQSQEPKEEEFCGKQQGLRSCAWRFLLDGLGEQQTNGGAVEGNTVYQLGGWEWVLSCRN
jgi:hypothetical protein